MLKRLIIIGLFSASGLTYAQNVSYCPLNGAGPTRVGTIDSSGGWWRVGGSPAITYITGDGSIPNVQTFTCLNPLAQNCGPEVAANPNFSFDNILQAMLPGSGGRAPGACPNPPCRRWPETIYPSDPSAPHTFYGTYVEERPIANPCAYDTGVLPFIHPSIGLMKSTDDGKTWYDLGIILDVPGGDSCTNLGNSQMMGGVGDHASIWDRNPSGFIYFIGQNYGPLTNQGFIIARLAWSNRDNPVGKAYWYNSTTGRYDIQAVQANSTPFPGVNYFQANVKPLRIFPNQRDWRTGAGVTPYNNYTQATLHYSAYLGRYVLVASKLWSGTSDPVASIPDWQIEGHYAAYLNTNGLETDPVNGWQAFGTHSTTAPALVKGYTQADGVGGLYPFEEAVGYPEFLGQGPSDDSTYSSGPQVYFWEANNSNLVVLSTSDVAPTCPVAAGPIITNVQAGAITNSGATITWMTNVPANSQVEYGTSTGYGRLSPLDTNLVTSHSEPLTGLAANTVYHYRVHSTDAANNSSVSRDFSFTTASNTVMTITFDDLSPAGRVLNGQYPAGVIDWGGGTDWWLSEPWGLFTTQSISFSSASQMSASFTFVSPHRLLSLQAYNGGSGATTITITCPGQTTRQAAVAAGQLLTIATGWSASCANVTLQSTNGWLSNFDNLVVDAP